MPVDEIEIARATRIDDENPRPVALRERIAAERERLLRQSRRLADEAVSLPVDHLLATGLGPTRILHADSTDQAARGTLLRSLPLGHLDPDELTSRLENAGFDASAVRLGSISTASSTSPSIPRLDRRRARISATPPPRRSSSSMVLGSAPWRDFNEA
ncbi:MAG TPA: hypothetical protein VFT22_36720 [Kofleriaceae bacterium]|nr:hypothetical protein [Kofleriaceae bacterium]